MNVEVETANDNLSAMIVFTLVRLVNRGGIPPLPHTIEILPYARDAISILNVTLFVDL